MHRVDLAALSQFVLLQISDVVSTILFLVLGGGEANPVVLWSMRAAGNPLTGLLLAKAALIPLVAYSIFARRQKPVRVANVVFAGLVLWNLTAILLKVLAPAS